MIDSKCTDMPLEDLNVSEECLDGLRKSGCNKVGELVEFLEQTWGGRAGTIGFAPYFLDHVDEVIDQLKVIGCWPKTLE